MFGAAFCFPWAKAVLSMGAMCRFAIGILIGLLFLVGCRSDELPAREIEIRVMGPDSVIVEGVEVPTDDMVNTLASLQATPETQIIIVADTAMPMGYLMDVQDRLRTANFARLNVRTVESID